MGSLRLNLLVLGVLIGFLARLSLVELAVRRADANIKKITQEVLDILSQKSEQLSGPDCKPVSFQPFNFIESYHVAPDGDDIWPKYTINGTAMYVFETSTVPLSQQIHLTVIIPTESSSDISLNHHDDHFRYITPIWFNNRVNRGTKLKELDRNNVLDCKSLQRLAYQHMINVLIGQREDSGSKRGDSHLSHSLAPSRKANKKILKEIYMIQSYLDDVTNELNGYYPCDIRRLKLHKQDYEILDSGRLFLIKAIVTSLNYRSHTVHLYVHLLVDQTGTERIQPGIFNNEVTIVSPLKPFAKTKSRKCPDYVTRY